MRRAALFWTSEVVGLGSGERIVAAFGCAVTLGSRGRWLEAELDSAIRRAVAAAASLGQGPPGPAGIGIKSASRRPEAVRR